MNAGGQDAQLTAPDAPGDAVVYSGNSVRSLPSGEFKGVWIAFYLPSERARQKADQRRQDAQDVAEGHRQEVEARNHWFCPDGGRPVVPPEVVPLLE